MSENLNETAQALLEVLTRNPRMRPIDDAFRTSAAVKKLERTAKKLEGQEKVFKGRYATATVNFVWQGEQDVDNFVKSVQITPTKFLSTEDLMQDIKMNIEREVKNTAFDIGREIKEFTKEIGQVAPQ